MAIELECPACGTFLRVGDDAAGRAVRCGHCLATLEVPVPEAEPDEPARAEPVAPPRPRRRPVRRARKRSVRAWLVGTLLVCGLIFLVCGGVVYLGGRPNWRTHESQAGGFRVDLPGPPRSDMAVWAGIKGDPNVKVEGTILFLRLEDYGVVYGDIDPAKRAQATDDAIMDDAVTGMLEAAPGGRVVRQGPVTVSGFPGREVVIDAPGQGVAVGRVVVAETRLFIAVSGGRMGDPGGDRARRFLDSFEVTEPRLLARRRQREDADRQAREQAEERKRATAALAEKFQADERRKADERAAFETAGRPGPPVPAASDLPGLVLDLPFDEPGPLTDRVSGREVGKFEKGARLGAGVRGTAAYTTAADSAVDLAAAAAALRFKSDQPFTVAGWYKCWEPQIANPLVATSAGPNVGTLRFMHGWGDMIVIVSSRRDVAAKGPRLKLDGLGLVNRDWHHFAITRAPLDDGGEVVELFIDGQSAGRSERTPATDLTTLDGVRAGVTHGHYPFVGALDEVCAFDRVLSALEIAYLAGREAAKPTDRDRLPAAPPPRAR